MRRPRVRQVIWVWAALLVGLAAGPSRGQEIRYLAFGDSVTDGKYDEANDDGYPGRLASALGCSPGVCNMDNRGKGGERTGAGVSRIETLLDANDYDVVLLMEGTNDIYKSPPVSNDTIQFNLETMIDKAAERGVDTVLGSIIRFHPDGTRGNSRDDEVENLRSRLIGVALGEGYYFVDNWPSLCPSDSCFNTHYYDGVPDPDPVGHPDASGYSIMADLWEGSIRSAPAPGLGVGAWPVGQLENIPATFWWIRESPATATWYQVEVDAPGALTLERWYKASEVCDLTLCTAPSPPGLGVGAYSWRVRGRNPLAYSGWSGSRYFGVLPGPPPVLTLESGVCSDAPDNAVTIRGEGFPPNREVGLVMAEGDAGTSRERAAECPDQNLEVSGPFVLPPTWVDADATGAFTVEMTGEKCFVQAVVRSNCIKSNLLELPNP